jgi:hypothetical protein
MRCRGGLRLGCRGRCRDCRRRRGLGRAGSRGCRRLRNCRYGSCGRTHDRSWLVSDRRGAGCRHCQQESRGDQQRNAQHSVLLGLASGLPRQRLGREIFAERYSIRALVRRPAGFAVLPGRPGRPAAGRGDPRIAERRPPRMAMTRGIDQSRTALVVAAAPNGLRSSGAGAGSSRARSGLGRPAGDGQAVRAENPPS